MDRKIYTYDETLGRYSDYLEVGSLDLKQYLKTYYLPVYDRKLNFLGYEKISAIQYLQD